MYNSHFTSLAVMQGLSLEAAGLPAAASAAGKQGGGMSAVVGPAADVERVVLCLSGILCALPGVPPALKNLVRSGRGDGGSGKDA